MLTLKKCSSYWKWFHQRHLCIKHLTFLQEQRYSQNTHSNVICSSSNATISTSLEIMSTFQDTKNMKHFLHFWSCFILFSKIKPVMLHPSLSPSIFCLLSCSLLHLSPAKSWIPLIKLVSFHWATVSLFSTPAQIRLNLSSTGLLLVNSLAHKWAIFACLCWKLARPLPCFLIQQGSCIRFNRFWCHT